MISRRDLIATGTAAAAALATSGLAATAARAADGGTPATGTGAGTAGSGGAERIKPASILPVDPADTPERIIAKAAAIVPRPPQVAWQERKVTGFTHFGMNTFTDREWGSGCEDEATFAPTAVDIDQWMRAYAAAGMRQVMLTAKHHDGFVVYPTRYTNHSVVASPWWYRGAPDATAAAARARAADARGDDYAAFWKIRGEGNVNPDGDILGTYLAAARRAGLKVGVYLSPADGAELPHAWHETFVAQIVAKHDAGKPLSTEEQSTYDDRDRTPSGMGRYGSGSTVTARTIPTLVEGDDRAGAVAAGRLPVFRVTADDYNAYYLNQLYELFTQYGPIDELWLDGANPWTSSGISEAYDFTTWFRLIHELSPDTVTFAGPQGTRWVGNEGGTARLTEWSVTPATADPATAHGEGLLPRGAQVTDIGSDAAITAPGVKYLQWFPAEADVSIRPGWFWHADEQPKTAEQLVSLYGTSVGRNAVLLLNVPPNTSGRVDDADVSELTRFGTAIAATYRRNLLEGARPAALAGTLTDGRLDSSWQPPARATTGSFVLQLPDGVEFDQVLLGEDITRGQHVQGFTVEAGDGTTWTPLASGTTIGYSRILTVPLQTGPHALRVTITEARATPHLSTLALHRTAPPPPAS